MRELFHRERQEADIIAAPTRMLDRRALAAASGARAQRRSLSLEVYGPPNGSRQQRTPTARCAGSSRTIPIPTASRAAGRRAWAAVAGPRSAATPPRRRPPRWLPDGGPRGDPLHPGPGGGAGDGCRRQRGLRDVCLAAWLRSGHGRGRLRCHQVTGDETKSRSNTMLLTMTGAAPQPIGLGETTQAC